MSDTLTVFVYANDVLAPFGLQLDRHVNRGLVITDLHGNLLGPEGPTSQIPDCPPGFCEASAAKARKVNMDLELARQAYRVMKEAGILDEDAVTINVDPDNLDW